MNSVHIYLSFPSFLLFSIWYLGNICSASREARCTVTFIHTQSINELSIWWLQIIRPPQPSHEIYKGGTPIETVEAKLRSLIVPRETMMVIVPTLAHTKEGHHRILPWLKSSRTRKRQKKVLLDPERLHERTFIGISCNRLFKRDNTLQLLSTTIYRCEVHFDKFSIVI